MGEVLVTPPAIEEFVMQGAKQPRLHFGAIAELVAFGCPRVEGLLCQVACVLLGLRKAIGKLVKALIETSDQTVKVQLIGHSRFIFNMNVKKPVCSRNSQFPSSPLMNQSGPNSANQKAAPIKKWLPWVERPGCDI
jgi:hypothetical protein